VTTFADALKQQCPLLLPVALGITPTKAPSDRANVAESNSEFCRQTLQGLAIRAASANLCHILRSQFRHWMALSRESLVRPSALRPAIAIVVQLRSLPQVRRIATQRVVAHMQTARLWPLAIGEKERNAMRRLTPRLEGKVTIAVRAACTDPWPACVGASGAIDSGPENNCSFFKGIFRWHLGLLYRLSAAPGVLAHRPAFLWLAKYSPNMTYETTGIV
jgi:hypothetical protein